MFRSELAICFIRFARTSKTRIRTLFAVGFRNYFFRITYAFSIEIGTVFTANTFFPEFV